MPALAVRRLAELSAPERARILARSTAAVFDADLQKSVAEIVEDVRGNGDEAVVRALARFDGVDCPPERLAVSVEEIEGAHASLDAAVLEGIRIGIGNIRRFNERVLEGASWRAEIEPGVLAGEQAGPIDSAGLFVPSGKGSFPSVLMHIGTPAAVARVPEIAVVVPPSAGSLEVDPAVLAVVRELGIERVFRANGPAGIAALAFGTETFPRASRVVGPGSPAIVAVQLQIQAFGCSTVMLFGPSESVVVADESADPVLLAADLLNEAEHGPDSTALLLTASPALADELAREVEAQLERLASPRRGYAAAAISDLGGALLVESVEEAVAFANEYAPEHLQLAVADPEALLPSIRHAGEILLGQLPFAAANYVLGVPATLPTGGFARSSSGITARTFTKWSSVAGASPDALAHLSEAAVPLAEHEGFPAHARALHLRAERR